MIHFRTGSQIHRLISVLSVAGEYPVHSLYILGNERMYKELVRKLTERQTIRNQQTNQDFTPAKVLNVAGKGASKTIRLYKGAIPILSWLNAEEYYLNTFWSHKFPGDAAHRERNHRVAETVAMFMNAGFEFRQYLLPELQNDRMLHIVPQTPSFYAGKALKRVGSAEMSKTIFTRIAGAAFAGGACYAVYNTRGAAMKWCGMGEFKSLHSLIETCRLNAGIGTVDSAILFGESYDVALATLNETERNHRLEMRFDAIYRHIFFVPLSAAGVRQLDLFTVPDWREKILDALFERESRSFDRGVFEYDACVDGRYILSHLDGDIARLIRFKEAISNIRVETEVICFGEQIEFLKEYFGEKVRLSVIERDAIEEAIGLERREMFEEK